MELNRKIFFLVLVDALPRRAKLNDAVRVRQDHAEIRCALAGLLDLLKQHIVTEARERMDGAGIVFVLLAEAVTQQF